MNVALFIFAATMLFASSASAQAGVACLGTSCGLGGQIRGQIGDGLPLPISIAPAQGGSGAAATAGPFTAITIQSAPATPSGLPLVGLGLGQSGQIKPTPSATIMQTTSPGMGPRALTLAPGVFEYASQPVRSVGVFNFAAAAFPVQTNLSYAFPHPGTTRSGAAAFTNGGTPIPTPAANVLFAGGRSGAGIVSFYADATANGTVGTNYGATINQTAMAGDAGTPPINGIARFTATGNQFGGQMINRTTGTAKVFFNGVPLDPAVDLPCKVTVSSMATGIAAGTTAQGTFVPYRTGTDCQFSLSIVDPTGSGATVGVAGGAFNGLAVGSAFMTTIGVFTGTIGFNGTVIGQGAPVTVIGANIPFTGEGNRQVGVPLTTGMLSITVTDVVGAISEMFIRTGTDARDAAGNGVVALVTGSMTARDISGGNANRTWITLEIPEPSAIAAASAGLIALFGCQCVARRRIG